MADIEIISEVPAKRVKTSEEKISEPLSTFTGFSISRVLNDNPSNHRCIVLGSFSDRDGDAVVAMEKTAFNPDQLSKILSGESTLKRTMQNDLYGTYACYPPPDTNDIKVTVIHPATQLHVNKYLYQPSILIEETGEDYRQITLPYIEKYHLSVKWLENILDHKAEQERIIFEDSDDELGFILLPDMKWDQKQNTDLYLVAITRKKILSIRELTSEHLPLLKNIQEKGKKIIKEKFDLNASKLRIYFHYQPSYYHLHVHFCHLDYDAPGTGCEKAHLLTNVINNLTLSSSYYKNAVISFREKEGSTLYKLFEDAERIEKPQLKN